MAFLFYYYSTASLLVDIPIWIDFCALANDKKDEVLGEHFFRLKRLFEKAFRDKFVETDTVESNFTPKRFYNCIF